MLSSSLARLYEVEPRPLVPRAYAFTEQGVPMLSSVLRSQRALHVNIEVMRAFVRPRHPIAARSDLRRSDCVWSSACTSAARIWRDWV